MLCELMIQTTAVTNIWKKGSVGSKERGRASLILGSSVGKNVHCRDLLNCSESCLGRPENVTYRNIFYLVGSHDQD